MINWDTLSGLARHILTFGGGFLVTNGVISSDELGLAVGAIITLGGIVWSVISKKKPAA
jgi:hypothetical protein